MISPVLHQPKIRIYLSGCSRGILCFSRTGREAPRAQRVNAASHQSHTHECPRESEEQQPVVCETHGEVMIHQFGAVEMLLAGVALTYSLPAVTWAAEATEAGATVAGATLKYVPEPVELSWQIWVGFVAGVFPFVLGAWEFGKRILIQRRCEKCGGSGLVKARQRLRKCPECGGFFPWLGWKTFFTSTAAPGNGGVLRRPRGQTGIFYKVPPPPPPRPEPPANGSQAKVDAPSFAEGLAEAGDAAERPQDARRRT